PISTLFPYTTLFRSLRMSVSVTGNPAQGAFAAELTERVLVALLLQRDYGDRATWLGEYLPRSLAAVRAFDQANDLEMAGEKNARSEEHTSELQSRGH